ncbi:MAG: CDP-alcohol phosphatidyltransferase family protein [Planctomycetota bacterium]|nr:CDP-alcohol phosphatidyltransferase family protein [Planctomycetota bacterium]MCX8039339.1 CDP-alcohol phosphatidyltransferase family protein [Planctomycetota bacterium]MDW8373630.1 CDP-alcohol phosphatidyltransferase family protein [Planctomycetota bacterium]
MRLADALTLSRLVIAPLAAAAYLWLPAPACWWVPLALCAAAELSDWLDGRIARARGEVSEFGQLADPFCDAFYRMALCMALVLPAGGRGVAVGAEAAADQWQPVYAVADAAGQLQLGAGLLPWLPVALMVLRELAQGALRSLCAARGLVLAARWSGKAKAWVQGALLIAALALAALSAGDPVILVPCALGAWAAAALSVASFVEYLWVHRRALAEAVR